MRRPGWDGIELISLYYNSAGSLVFNLAACPTVGAAGYRHANGDYGFGLGGDGLKFDYEGRPGRQPMVKLHGRGAGRHARYRVTAEGGLIPEPAAPAE